MPRAKCKWRATEATRAVRAVEKATGRPVTGCEYRRSGNEQNIPAGSHGLIPNVAGANTFLAAEHGKTLTRHFALGRQWKAPSSLGPSCITVHR